MRTRKLSAVVVSFVAGLAAACSQPSSQSGSAAVQGSVSGASSALRVTAAGSAAATTDSASSFVLVGVPAGVSSLRFDGAGLSATLQIVPMVAGESRSIAVAVANGAVAELHERSSTRFAGPIESISTDGLVAAGREVSVTSATAITLDGAAAALADLAAGDVAMVEGALLSDGTVQARTVDASTAGRDAGWCDEDGGTGDHDGGSGDHDGGWGPPPPPDGGWGPPPPPPAPDGGWGDHDGGWGPPPPPDGGWGPPPPPPAPDGGWGDHDGGSGEHDGGWGPPPPPPAPDAGEGDHDGGEGGHDGGPRPHDVTAGNDGGAADAGPHCRPRPPQPPPGGQDAGPAPQPGDVIFMGELTSINGSSATVAGIAVELTATTEVLSGGAASTASALQAGQRVGVDGTLQADHSVAARIIDILRPAAPPVLHVFGPISAIDATAKTFTIGQTVVATNAQTKFASAQGFAGLRLQENVQAEATLQADGSLLATAVAEARH